jgi:hypothetical protein
MFSSSAKRGEAFFCFHPADQPSLRDGSVSPCFHPGDADISAGVNLCHHPADPGNGAGCFHPTDSLTGGVNSCYHPADPVTGNVNCCYHPADEDLAVDLHLTLTGIDGHHLAALAPSRP